MDVKGNVEWKIDDGDIDDLKDLKSDKNTTYSAKDAWVMKTVDDETARLVYIFWTETEKGDTRDITFHRFRLHCEVRVRHHFCGRQGGHCQRQGHGCQVLYQCC